MATHFENLTQQVLDAQVKLRQLTQIDYTSHDIKDILKDLGSNLEVFLKISAFPYKNQRHDFVQFINELLTVGIAQADIDVLHLLRTGYNNSKHNPQYEPRLLETINLINDVQLSLRKLRLMNFGRIKEQVPQKYKRVLWLFAWDHYNGGDTEVSIMIPSFDKDLAPSLDDIYIDISAWDAVVSDLKSVGAFEIGEQFFPKNLYDFYAGEGDFLAGGVFEGEYKYLIKTLAKYELRQGLLYGLNRHDSPISMLQALILAAVEVAPTFGAEPSTDALEDHIKNVACNSYAVPSEYRHLEKLVKEVARLLEMLDFSLWQAVSGPTWLNIVHYNEAEQDALAISPELFIMIDKNCVFRLSRNT